MDNDQGIGDLQRDERKADGPYVPRCHKRPEEMTFAELIQGMRDGVDEIQRLADDMKRQGIACLVTARKYAGEIEK